ncbi:ectoine/hydroxyectoine ABC transporter permease subunit EhuD [Mycolicibacterium duvalii]|uniref:Ectoine/hydroxyectoine ABC transporter permease subunit EhuD n=1 Tax=Mycolicibacterium duvalii TaxID=39688 RepID=A0A7I7K0X2_9MYCO|nr:ectoine/hydroxyectoine ABC transporter permease subunit EhuD [Mycolicibacterium duvalii]MCV7369759.1 ectoine/hydroxyectoine ABC transporter permease subunit EhuD [Mycolicibacterium duvalii]PEG43468.1 ectoine/hydroxyectoine ABC transporter permease subunit EhuD [Mycolicibacterium duvalii]BBX17244.1 ectoine/hydroxyectoine ABC transporter permease subunit EhuD [Mycolicibacterium duvalii]
MTGERSLWDWDYAADVLPGLLTAFLKLTLGITAAASAVAIVAGLALVLLRRADSRWISWPAYAVIEFVRSTPIPIQLFFVYFGLPVLGIRPSALITGIAVLGVHYACYMSEVYRAGIDAIPPGQWEAATALSLPPYRTWRAVILPQVIRRVLPSTGNQVIALFKETPFLIVIGVAEMVTVANQFGGQNYRYIEPITIAGLIFLAASYPTSVLMRKLEIRLAQ